MSYRIVSYRIASYGVLIRTYALLNNVIYSDLECMILSELTKKFQRHEAPRRLSATAELLEYIRRVIIFICFCCGNSEADSRRPKVVPQFTFAHNTAFCHWNWWTLTSIVVSDVALDSVCGLNGRERLNWLVIIRTGYFFHRANSFNNSLTVNNSSIDTETATSVCLILSLRITVKTSAVERSESRLSQLCAENDFCIFWPVIWILSHFGKKN